MRACFCLLFLLGLLAQPCQAQFFINPPKDRLVYVLDGVDIREDAPQFDQEPSFPGGRIELFRYLERHIPLTNPAMAEAGLYGSTVIAFTLDAAGRITGVSIERTNTPSIESAFIRAIQEMPDWIPAQVDGVESAVLVYLPLGYQWNSGTFVFDESTTKAILGRNKKSNWLKGVLLGGAIAVAVVLFVGLR